jgi:hypothetical protein
MEKGIALGEARTHGLQIMRLTRCLLRYEGLVNDSAIFLEHYHHFHYLRDQK